MLELTMLLTHAEGALVRTLGLIERRGFRLGAMTVRPNVHGLQVTLNVSAADRAPDVLLRQIRRLGDVREVSMDVPRPAFTLPASAIPPPIAAPKPNRRGISFLGIPERISAN
jgi:acetolactate synthase II small subunit